MTIRRRLAIGPDMHGLRISLRNNLWLAFLVVTLALGVKALLPAGYMPSGGARVLTVSICADASGGSQLRQIVIPEKGGKSASDHRQSDTCSFAGHTMPSLGGADPIVLTLALAFIMELGFAAPVRPNILAVARLRPPLRGPPAQA